MNELTPSQGLQVHWLVDRNKISDRPAYEKVTKHLLVRMRDNPDYKVPSKEGVYLSNLVDHLKVIVCNLSAASTAEVWIAFQRGGGAYKADPTYRGFQFSSGNVRKVTTFLKERGYIEWVPGYPGSKDWAPQLYKMRATGKLLDLLDRFGANPATIYRDSSLEETVIVKGKKKVPPKRLWKDGKRPKPKREVILTPNTRHVQQLRKNLETINGVIRANRIELDMDQLELQELNELLAGDPSKYKRPLDFTNVNLYRVFIGKQLHLGGRFYGGWWEGIPGKDRECILINRNPTSELDFSELHPNMLYGLEEESPPATGSYYLTEYPRTPEVRKFLKWFLLILINARNPESAKRAIRKAYKGKGHPPIELTDASLDPVIEQLRELHAPIQHYFDEEDAGNMLMNIDSEIAEEILLHFARKHVACLPVHDSFIIDSQYSSECWDVMRKAFSWRFGQQIPIDYQDVMTAYQRYNNEQSVLPLSKEWNEIESEITHDIKVGDPRDYEGDGR